MMIKMQYKKSTVTEEEAEGYYVFLEDLRQSGKINMFFAPKVLEDLFNLDKDDAIQIFLWWSKHKEAEAALLDY